MSTKFTYEQSVELWRAHKLVVSATRADLPTEMIAAIDRQTMFALISRLIDVGEAKRMEMMAQVREDLLRLLVTDDSDTAVAAGICHLMADQVVESGAAILEGSGICDLHFLIDADMSVPWHQRGLLLPIEDRGIMVASRTRH